MRGKRVLTQNLSQELILLRSGCSPSMSVEQTPGPMGTGRSSMKEDARSCGQNYWNLSGKKSSMSGQRDQRQDFQNSLVNVLVKRLVMQKHLKGMKKQLLKKKRRKKRKKLLATGQILLSLLPYQEEIYICTSAQHQNSTWGIVEVIYKCTQIPQPNIRTAPGEL